jgi:hypothetical protein
VREHGGGGRCGSGRATVEREKSDISGSAVSEQAGAVRGSTLRTTKHTGYSPGIPPRSQAQAATGLASARRPLSGRLTRRAVSLTGAQAAD